MYTREIMDKKSLPIMTDPFLVLLFPLSVNNGVVGTFLVDASVFVNAVRK